MEQSVGFAICSITATVHVCRVNQLQGSNTFLRSNLDRVTKERDEKQRSLQQLSTQQSGLSAFTAAEAQKEVNTLRHQLAFKAQEVTSACSHPFLCCLSCPMALLSVFGTPTYKTGCSTKEYRISCAITKACLNRRCGLYEWMTHTAFSGLL